MAQDRPVNPILSLERVSYTYPATSQPALREVSLALPAGQFCAIVGGNGAGKSTLGYAIAGYVPHFYHGELQGEVIVAGKNTREAAIGDLVSSVGLVFQNPFNQISGTRLTVREEIAFGMENLGVDREEMEGRCQAVMELVSIGDIAERSPVSLSGGQMQRVAIASILVIEPQILVLDEPTSQLDPIGSREVLAAIQSLAGRRGITVIVIEHKLEWLAAHAERVIALHEGMLVADGAPGEVLADESLWGRGVGHTRYTHVAWQARHADCWPAGLPLPVTLEQAGDRFQLSRKP